MLTQKQIEQLQTICGELKEQTGLELHTDHFGFILPMDKREDAAEIFKKINEDYSQYFETDPETQLIRFVGTDHRSMKKDIDIQEKRQIPEEYLREHFKDWSEKDLLMKVHSINLELANNERNWGIGPIGKSYLKGHFLSGELYKHSDALQLLHGYQNVFSPEFWAKAENAYLEKHPEPGKDKDRDDLDLELE